MKTKKVYTKEEVLAKYLECDIEEAEQLIGDGDYMVLTDEEADEKAREYILDSVWAFNKSFLDCHSKCIAEMDDKVFIKIQEMCESANDTITRLIDDIDYFVEDAISADGRGHFLSTYDGEEVEAENAEGKMFYIYRAN